MPAKGSFRAHPSFPPARQQSTLIAAPTLPGLRKMRKFLNTEVIANIHIETQKPGRHVERSLFMKITARMITILPDPSSDGRWQHTAGKVQPPLVLILVTIVQKALTKVLHVTTTAMINQPVPRALLIRVHIHVIVMRTVQDRELHACPLLRTEHGKSVESPILPSKFQRSAEDALLMLRRLPIPLLEATSVRKAEHRR